MPESLNDAFMKGKEEIALQHVKYLTEKLELKMTPSVAFCDGFTPAGQNALACIDTSTWVIYISRIYLSKMDTAQIKETIAHEMAHLFDPTHEPGFHKKLTDINSALWKPESTSGIIMIDGSGRTEKTPGKTTKPKINKTHCNYHLCRKKTELTQCPHCKGYFCKDCIKPTIPGLPNPDNPKEFYEWKLKEKCHPCPDYFDYLVEKEKEIIRKAEESLNRMNNFGFRYEKVEIIKKETVFEVIPESEITEEAKKNVLPASGINCFYCDKESEMDEVEYFYEPDLEKMVTLCKECWETRREGKFPKKKVEDKIDIKKCSFCNQSEAKGLNELIQCGHCEEWFCKEHIKSKTLHESLGSKGGHPCSSFNEKQKSVKETNQLPQKQGDVDKKQSIWKRLRLK